jgi:DNA-binding transcriptional LysR family regulator
MNIHHLELFYHVARNGGISEAVRNMPYGIQQPAVSGQILQLEADLGTKLFQRRPFELTPAGEILFHFIRPFFSGIDGVADKIRGGTTQIIRMAAPEIILRNHLPTILKEVRNDFPKLRLTLKAAHQPQVESWLEAQEIDLAITLMEKKFSSGLFAEPLLKLPAVFLVQDATPYTSAAQILEALTIGGNALEGTPQEPLITLPPNEMLPRKFRELLAARGTEWPQSIEVTALELIDIYVLNGFGIGLTFGGSARTSQPGLRVLPIEDMESLTVGVLWKGKLSPLAASLVHALRKRAQILSETIKPK